MLKETIHYEDYNGEARVTTEYFHLTEKEIVDLQAHSEHGLQADLEDAIKSKDVGKVLDYITNLVHLSYGKKTVDGKQFVKSEEILNEFKHSAYYSDFLLGLIKDDGRKGQEFINGVMPKKLVDRAYAQSQGQPTAPASRETYESTVHAPSAREMFAQRSNELQQPAAPSEFQPVSAPTPVPTSPPADPDYAAYLAWKEQQKVQQAPAEPVRTQEEPSFRVPSEEEVNPGLPRPPHEQ